jgi:urea transport system substrate-binding protein
MRYAVLLIGVLVRAASGLAAGLPPAKETGPIRVGILHSLTGTMAISEQSLVDATMLAIHQINAAGGLLGRQIEPLVEDGASDPATFARKAELLIQRDRVCSIFGCWTSDCRLAVRPIVEKLNHLLWYPLQYEGGIPSPNIIYTGEVANQQLLPALHWAMARFGSRAFLVGSEYGYPRSANRILRKALETNGGECVGEAYKPLGEQNFTTIVDQIRHSGPDFVLSTVNGDSNLGFYRQMNQAGIAAEHAPVIAFSIAEDEIRQIGSAPTRGHYCSWSYFQSLSTPGNLAFVRAFKQRYGEDRVTDAPIATAYTQVYLFAEAVRKAKSAQVNAILTACQGLQIDGPSGPIRIDPVNHHTWKYARVGQIERTGQVRTVWSSPTIIAPIIDYK